MVEVATFTWGGGAVMFSIWPPEYLDANWKIGRRVWTMYISRLNGTIGSAFLFFCVSNNFAERQFQACALHRFPYTNIGRHYWFVVYGNVTIRRSCAFVKTRVELKKKKKRIAFNTHNNRRIPCVLLHTIRVPLLLFRGFFSHSPRRRRRRVYGCGPCQTDNDSLKLN